MKTIVLEDYNIHVGDIWDQLNTFLEQKKYSKLFVLVRFNLEKNIRISIRVVLFGIK